MEDCPNCPHDVDEDFMKLLTPLNKTGIITSVPWKDPKPITKADIEKVIQLLTEQPYKPDYRYEI